MIQINDPIRTQIRSGSDLYLILSNQDHIRINDSIHDLVWILYGSIDQTRIHDLDLIGHSDPSMIWDPLQILDPTLIGYSDPSMIWDPLQILDPTLIGHSDPSMIWDPLQILDPTLIGY
jgi:hypothetical protein